MLNDDPVTIGFMLAGFVWTLWWNLDWRRYLQFYGFTGPTYPVGVQWLSPTFFAFCSLGTAVGLGRRLLTARPVQFYFYCLLVAGAWFAAIVLMVLAAESTMKKRRKKANPQ